MKRIAFTENNRSGNELHIEAPGCTVTIQVNLRDADGNTVTLVGVSPLDETRGPENDGTYWHAEDADGAQLPGVTARVVHQPRPVSARYWDARAFDESAGNYAERIAGLIAKARDWALDCEWLDTDEIADMSPAQIVAGIEEHYDGGWAAFVAAETV